MVNLIAQVGAQSDSPLDGVESFLTGISVLVVVYALATLGYWLPSLIAAFRRSPFMIHVLAMNGLAGWTVIGWFLAVRIALDTGAGPGRGLPPRQPGGTSASPPSSPNWYPAGPAEQGPGYDPRNRPATGS